MQLWVSKYFPSDGWYGICNAILAVVPANSADSLQRFVASNNPKTSPAQMPDLAGLLKTIFAIKYIYIYIIALISHYKCEGKIS